MVKYRIRYKLNNLYNIQEYIEEDNSKFDGVNANFDVIYETRNIKANIVIDTTVGDMYEFYKQLLEAYEKLDRKAILKNYGNSR